MSLHEELNDDQQDFIDSFLLEDLNELQLFPFSALYDITEVLSGYRSVAESSWQDMYNPEDSTTSEPEPKRLQEFFQKSGVPHFKVHKDEKCRDERNSMTTYMLFETDAYNDALEALQTFTKDSEGIDYHGKLGKLLGYPEFAGKDFEEHGWEEPELEDQIEFILNQEGDLLDLTLMIVALPYSLPLTDEYRVSAYEDVQTYRTQMRLHIDEYEYMNELLWQSQEKLVEDLGDQHEFIAEDNILEPVDL